MEEILASIRRIIADDQSLPGRGEAVASETSDQEGVDVADAAEPHEVEPSTPAVHVLHPVPQSQASLSQDRGSHPLPGEETSADEQALALAASMARGSIAAPQYASPRFPMGDQGSQPVPSTVKQGRDDAIADGGSHQDVRTSDGQPMGDTHNHAGGRGAHAEAPSLDTGSTPLISSTTNDSVTSAFNVLAAARMANNSEELRALVRDMLRPILATWLDENLPGIVENMVRSEIERVARGGH